MTNRIIAAAAALALATPVTAQEASDAPPSPGEIVAKASAEEWVAIPAEDLLVMSLAPDAQGKAREVVIQLIPSPFSHGWVENIRTLARAGWYDDIAVNRVQDNYVVQWGDPNYDNPEAEGEAKPLPDGLRVMREDEYTSAPSEETPTVFAFEDNRRPVPAGPCYWVEDESRYDCSAAPGLIKPPTSYEGEIGRYSVLEHFEGGWPVGFDFDRIWPVHCYGMVGVGRGMSPDTGSGAELYTVIGHAPRHLDRNIALVGRIVEGMEHLSSMPRGSGDLGFYTAEETHKRTPILSVRVASDLSEGERPAFEYLSTDGETFARYAEARANRRDPFFIVPAGGADICNIPVPIRRVSK
ncbi:MAG: peptidylprolyl isomerase [Citromicrobium sp.]|nr:MAG: peptidylprolyl isomerase [Citromicrobium sp.]